MNLFPKEEEGVQGVQGVQGEEPGVGIRESGVMVRRHGESRSRLLVLLVLLELLVLLLFSLCGNKPRRRLVFTIKRTACELFL
jgi:hypothetical protein